MESSDTIVADLFKSGVFLLFGSIFGTFGGFLARAFTARFLTTESYGALVLALSIITALSTIILLGLNQGLGRYLPRRDQPEEQREFLLAGFSISVPIAFIIGVVLVGFGPTIGNAFSDDNLVGRMFQLLGFALPCIVITRLCIGGIQGLEHSLPKTLIQDFTIPLTRIILLAAIILIGANVSEIALAYLFSFVAGTFVASYYLLKYGPISQLSQIKIRNLGGKRRELLSFSLPLTVTSVMSVLFSNIDTVMLGYFTTTSDVGIYDVAYLIANFIVIVLSSFLFLFMPVFSRLHSEDEQEQMRDIYTLTTKWAFIIALPLLILMVGFPNMIISLTFGQDYVSEAAILSLLALGFFSNVATGPNGNALVALGKTRFIMIVNIFVAILNFILNLVLIPRYSIFGATIATASSYILLNALSSFELYSETRIHPFNLSNIQLGGGSILVFAIAYQLVPLTKLEGYLEPIAVISVFLIAYPFLVLALVTFRPEEIAIVERIEEYIGLRLYYLKYLMK